MKHIFNISIAALAVTALSLLAACQKRDIKGDGTAFPLSFDVAVGNPEIDVQPGDATKADNIKTSIDNFRIAGYTGTASWFAEQTVSTSSMIFSDKLWIPGETHTFFAYANLPASGATATITSTGVTLSYTAVPTSQADQQDILLGSYSGEGVKGKASIKFYHPLAAVRFKVGTITGATVIKGIALDGVYKSGSVKLSETSGTPAFAWTPSGSQEVSQSSLNVPTIYPNNSIGYPFILIPQDFTAKSLTVKITITVNGTDRTITATLNTGSIAAGKTTTYAVNYSAAKGLNFSTPTVTAWGTGDNLTATLEEEPQVPNDEIWYTSTNGGIIPTASNASTNTFFFGAKLLSNTYSDDKGIMKFDGPVTKLCDAIYHATNVDEIWLPNSVEELLEESLDRCSGAQVIKIHLPNSVKKIDGSAIYDCDNAPSQVYAFVTSTNEYTLYLHKDGSSMSTYKLHLGSITGPTSFTIMPQNIVYTCGTVHCFAKGTLLTLADGTQKKVEELTYSDRLKVWNFDEGKDDTAGILWMNNAGQKCPYFFRCVLSNGTVLDLVGEESEGTHRLFDKTAGKFLYPDQMNPGSKVYTEHGLVEVVSFERIDEEVEFYNLITDRHINCYINNVLSSCRYNNIYPIDENMKFVKDGRKKRPYSEFKAAGIGREWYVGMRLGEQTYDVEDVAAYVAKCEAHMAEKPAPTFWQKLKTWWKSIFG